MPALRLPNYNREHSSHVLVATAACPMNFRTLQICLSYTDSDHALTQQKTGTTHVSTFQLLYSQHVGLGLLVEPLACGAEITAEIIAEARDCVPDVYEAPSLRQ